MTTAQPDSLLTELTMLGVRAPRDLLDKVAARWVRVAGPLGDLYVASTDHGVVFVSSDTALARAPSTAGGPGIATGAPGKRVSSDGTTSPTAEEMFVASFRERFRRPLLPGRRAPSGVLSALRTGHAHSVRFDLRGSTPFARAVLRATSSIPKGQVRPYGWVASQIGHPKAVRAVGTALGNNPVPLLIPCHRVVRSDGQIGNYGMGTDVKRYLLADEGANVDEIAELARHGVHYVASDTTGIVCFPSCSDARRIVPAHRAGYATMGEAVRDGFRPCRRCRPGGPDGSDPGTPVGTGGTGADDA